MANTTNYNWATPDDTDLVKDGAAAIRTLGSSIDTTTKNLNPQTTTGALAYRSATANVNTALPIGTAGQILKVNSGATAPEWATPAAAGGGLVKIAKTTFSGAVSASFNDVFSSTYNNYRILIQLDSTSANNQPVAFRLRVSGSDSSTNYRSATSYNEGTDTAAATKNLAGTDEFRMPEIDDTYSDEWYANIDLFSPQQTRKTGYLATSYNTRSNNTENYEMTTGVNTAATSYTGFTLLSATGNLAGTVWIYGYEN